MLFKAGVYLLPFKITVLMQGKWNIPTEYDKKQFYPLSLKAGLSFTLFSMTRSLFRIQQRKQESSARRQNELFVITVVFYVSSVTPPGGGGGTSYNGLYVEVP